MKRSARFNLGFLPVAAAIAWSATADLSSAQQRNDSNPLRTARKPAIKVATSPAPAIGTAVRTSAKRTPESPALLAEESEPVEVKSSATRSKSNGVSQAAYQRRVTRPSTSSPTIREQRYSGASVLRGTVTVQEPAMAAPMEDGGTIYESEGEPYFDGFEGLEDGNCCNGCGVCDQCCLMSCPQIRWDDLTIFGGAQGFTGPKNFGATGSFGFHEGFNWGAPFPCSNGCLGVQMGARFVQANLSGSEFSADTRHQTFVTGGLFRRVDCGLQFGAVFDYQLDDWYTKTELTQVRGEISWVFPCAHELGFWTSQSLDEHEADGLVVLNNVPTNITETWEGTDLYAFYYRHQFAGWEGTNMRLFAGFTGDSDGLIGSDFQVPLACDLALQAGFTYLVPEQAKGPTATGNEEESWNVAVSLVWYPGCGTATGKSYFAPLMNVADNGSFMVGLLQ
jgi:hypothetical protein